MQGSSKNSYHIYGLNTVDLIFKSCPQRIIEIHTVANLMHKFSGIKVVKTTAKELNHLFPDVNHQNVVALVKSKPHLQFEELVSNEDLDRIVILDRITDIGNIGAIIRSALAFKINKFILPKHDSCIDASKIAKSSSGYSELAQIAVATNLNDVLAELKKQNYWCFGLDGLAKNDITILKNYPKLALVLGNEHQGIKASLRKNCDMLVKIPTDGIVESLNVSVAAAITFYNIK
ncbi:MAG: 23S rRNA (guanosine(2251)-2'-O)-methyltransferase RlmB [Rickettsiales bacterium]|nr:23S rRNA (guanosine(2251)-2'-O)-methyltransferase RlmB [Rickettsiales bacterium]